MALLTDDDSGVTSEISPFKQRSYRTEIRLDLVGFRFRHAQQPVEHVRSDVGEVGSHVLPAARLLEQVGRFAYCPPACFGGSVGATSGALMDQFDPDTLERRKSAVVGRGCAASAGGLNVDERGTITLSLAARVGFPLKSPVLGAPPCPGPSPAGSLISRVSKDGFPIFSTYVGCGAPPPLAFARDGRILVSINQAENAVVLGFNPNPAPVLSLDRVTNATSGDDGAIVPGGLYTVRGGYGCRMGMILDGMLRICHSLWRAFK